MLRLMTGVLLLYSVPYFFTIINYVYLSLRFSAMHSPVTSTGLCFKSSLLTYGFARKKPVFEKVGAAVAPKVVP
jgi:hypothetical protein